MYSYAGQSSTATKVTHFQTAPEVVNPVGHGDAGRAAVSQRDGEHHGEQTSKTLQSLAQPPATATTNATTQAATATDPLSELWFLLTGQTACPPAWDRRSTATPPSPASSTTRKVCRTSVPVWATPSCRSPSRRVDRRRGLAAAAKALPGLGGLGGMLGGGAAAAHPVAALGSAASVGGKLSVPVAWSGAPATQAVGPFRGFRSAHQRRPGGRGGTRQPARWHAAGRYRRRRPWSRPVPSTDSGPPSWPDHRSRDSPRRPRDLRRALPRNTGGRARFARRASGTADRAANERSPHRSRRVASGPPQRILRGLYLRPDFYPALGFSRAPSPRHAPMSAM